MFQIFKRLREVGRTLQEPTFARARVREKKRDRGEWNEFAVTQLGAARCDYEGRVEGEFSTLRCVKVLTRFSKREARGGMKNPQA